MQRFLTKPQTMTIQEYAARVVEMNNCQPRFPEFREGEAHTKLLEDEMLDFLEFSIPKEWQQIMFNQDFGLM